MLTKLTKLSVLLFSVQNKCTVTKLFHFLIIVGGVCLKIVPDSVN